MILQAIFTTRSRSDDHPVVGRAVRLGASGHLFRSILHLANSPGGRASSRLLRVHVADVSRGVYRSRRAQILQIDLTGLPQRLSTWNQVCAIATTLNPLSSSWLKFPTVRQDNKKILPPNELQTLLSHVSSLYIKHRTVESFQRSGETYRAI